MTGGNVDQIHGGGFAIGGTRLGRHFDGSGDAQKHDAIVVAQNGRPALADHAVAAFDKIKELGMEIQRGEDQCAPAIFFDGDGGKQIKPAQAEQLGHWPHHGGFKTFGGGSAGARKDPAGPAIFEKVDFGDSPSFIEQSIARVILIEFDEIIGSGHDGGVTGKAQGKLGKVIGTYIAVNRRDVLGPDGDFKWMEKTIQFEIEPSDGLIESDGNSMNAEPVMDCWAMHRNDSGGSAALRVTAENIGKIGKAASEKVT